MADELRAKLQEELEKLDEVISIARRRGVEQNQVEQRTNEFEMEWLDRIAEAQKNEVRGIKTGIEAVFEEFTRQQQQERDTKDAERLPVMSPQNQVAFWMSTRPENGANVFQEQERARFVRDITDTTTKRINADYAALRDDFVKAVQEIEAGRPPHGFTQGELETNRNANPRPPAPSVALTVQQQVARNSFDEMVKAAQREQENERGR